MTVPLDVHRLNHRRNTAVSTRIFEGATKDEASTITKTSSESVTRFYNHSSIIAFDLTGEICTDYSGIRFI